MPARLGELLIEAGLLSDEQVAQGLRAQVMWGGRLGTNLVELGYVDLDDIARLLGRQQRYPAALGWHFEHADTTLQKQLSAELAERHACLPIARAGDKTIVATVAPLDERARIAIAAELNTTSAHLIPALAAEHRMRYHLERVYDLARETRYLRSRSACRLPFDAQVECDASRRLASSDEDRALPIVETPPDPRQHKPLVRERRRYVTTLGVPELFGLEPPTRFARGTDAMKSRRRMPSLGPSLHSAARAIRTSSDRDQLADQVIATLAAFAPSCQSAMLLVVRGAVAIPACGFRRDGGLIPDIAVPLDQPGLVPAVIRDRDARREVAIALGTVDAQLLDALGGGGDLIVEPIQVFGHVMSVLAAVARFGEPVPSIGSVAQAASAAFSRLMRDAAK